MHVAGRCLWRTGLLLPDALSFGPREEIDVTYTDSVDIDVTYRDDTP